MNDVRPGITANRYEQKFALNREDVDRLESAVAGQLRLADHGHGPETRITTVYFDHADLDLFLAAVRAPRQAVKVRLREYTTPAGMLTGRVLQMKFHEPSR